MYNLVFILILYVYEHCKNVTGSLKWGLIADPEATSLKSCNLTYEFGSW